jgi:hypothetical protein
VILTAGDDVVVTKSGKQTYGFDRLSSSLDGGLRPNNARQMVRQLGLHLVSKRRDHAALYVPDEGPYAGRGPRRTYGERLDDRPLPAEHVQVTSMAFFKTPGMD